MDVANPGFAVRVGNSPPPRQSEMSSQKSKRDGLFCLLMRGAELENKIFQASFRRTANSHLTPLNSTRSLGVETLGVETVAHQY